MAGMERLMTRKKRETDKEREVSKGQGGVGNFFFFFESLSVSREKFNSLIFQLLEWISIVCAVCVYVMGGYVGEREICVPIFCSWRFKKSLDQHYLIEI